MIQLRRWATADLLVGCWREPREGENDKWPATTENPNWIFEDTTGEFEMPSHRISN